MKNSDPYTFQVVCFFILFIDFYRTEIRLSSTSASCCSHRIWTSYESSGKQWRLWSFKALVLAGRQQCSTSLRPTTHLVTPASLQWLAWPWTEERGKRKVVGGVWKTSCYNEACGGQGFNEGRKKKVLHVGWGSIIALLLTLYFSRLISIVFLLTTCIQCKPGSRQENYFKRHGNKQK